MASALTTPLPPERIWSQLQQQLDRQPAGQYPPMPADQNRRWFFPTPRLVALAATLLIALWIGRFAYRSMFPHGEHHQFTAEFGHYLEKFQRDPATAQHFLLAKYENQLVHPDQVIQTVGYRPAVADGMPEGYTLEATHVMTMPCCTCVQCLFTRSDGSTIAIFEHDDEQTDWFRDRQKTDAVCGGKPCRLVELDDRIAAHWRRGKRHITVIGARDTAEIEQLVAWFDNRRHIQPQ